MSLVVANHDGFMHDIANQPQSCVKLILKLSFFLGQLLLLQLEFLALLLVLSYVLLGLCLLTDLLVEGVEFLGTLV